MPLLSPSLTLKLPNKSTRGHLAAPLVSLAHPLVPVCVQLLFFGGGTTGALTWATSTYVLTMHTVPGKDAYTITTPTLTGGSKETEVAWADVTRPIGYHPFSTFEAAGKKFYLDELGEMHDESFPSKLEEALNKE